jgi:hypothetical protein
LPATNAVLLLVSNSQSMACAIFALQ